MAILSNQGTLLYTPQGGTQSSVASNITSTELNVTYGLEVTHAATPTNFVTGDTISYTVLLRNTGTGPLYNPFVTVETGGALDYQEGSATAEVGDTIDYQFTVTNNGAASITLDGLEDQLPEGFSFTTVTLVVDGVPVSLTEGTDYTVSPTGLFRLTPDAAISIPGGAEAVLVITGVITL